MAVSESSVLSALLEADLARLVPGTPTPSALHHRGGVVPPARAEASPLRLQHLGDRAVAEVERLLA